MNSCARRALAFVLSLAAVCASRTWDELKLDPESEALFELVKTRKTDDKHSIVSEVRKLLDEGANPSTQGEYNYTALMWTVVRDHQDATSVLLEAGAETEAVNAWGRNALFLAAWDGRDDSMKAMLANGANVSGCADHDGWTALHKAAELGRRAQVRLAVRHKPLLSCADSFHALRSLAPSPLRWRCFSKPAPIPH